jgi:hypothetical protein
MNKTFNITSTGSFTQCVQRLVQKDCDAIYGPRGGILVVNSQHCLVYQNGEAPYFGAHDYLGEWRTIVFAENYTPLVTDPAWEHPRDPD